MVKGTLVFDLPEDEAAFREAQDGPQWKYLLMDILAHLRNECKYTDATKDKAKSARLAAFEEIRELIWNSIEDRKLKAD
jgi:hypothetical protein